ncbi:hypothetical protein [Edaphobacter modestus]|uniref:hypothetical protein n=1 Tax=Edaphobacter modestus TaxID=388466 RepID=UPI00102B34CE|nr:hypothetical protein [Edaphobacter modestus]
MACDGSETPMLSQEASDLLREDEDHVIRVISRTPRLDFEAETAEELDAVDRFVRERYGLTPNENIYDLVPANATAVDPEGVPKFGNVGAASRRPAAARLRACGRTPGWGSIRLPSKKRDEQSADCQVLPIAD